MEVKYHLTGLEVESEEDDIGKSVAQGPAPGECSVAGGQVWSLKALFLAFSIGIPGTARSVLDTHVCALHIKRMGFLVPPPPTDFCPAETA